jgi:hypothetical protein
MGRGAAFTFFEASSTGAADVGRSQVAGGVKHGRQIPFMSKNKVSGPRYFVLD